MTDTITPEGLIRQLHWRYAVKKFDPSRKIPDDMWNALEQTLVLTPSSYGLQPWRFVVLTDPEVKERLVPLSWNQRQPADCSHYVVFAARTEMTETQIDEHLARVAEVRGTPMDSLAGFRKMLVSAFVTMPPGFDVHEWAARQAYIALGNFMTAAALLGIDTCPMEGLAPAKYDEVLNLRADGFATVVACAAGYRMADDKYAALKKVRFPADRVIQRV